MRNKTVVERAAKYNLKMSSEERKIFTVLQLKSDKYIPDLPMSEISRK